MEIKVKTKPFVRSYSKHTGAGVVTTSINVDPNLLKIIDAYANNKNMSRSMFIITTVKEKLRDEGILNVYE